MVTALTLSRHRTRLIGLLGPFIFEKTFATFYFSATFCLGLKIENFFSFAKGERRISTLAEALLKAKRKGKR